MLIVLELVVLKKSNVCTITLCSKTCPLPPIMVKSQDPDSGGSATVSDGPIVKGPAVRQKKKSKTSQDKVCTKKTCMFILVYVAML